MGRMLTEKIGEISKNNFGSIMKIVKYNGNRDIWVQFENGLVVHTQYNNFLLGNVKNVYDKSVYGVGFIGEGEYKVSADRKITPQYAAWRSMIQRCYDKKFQADNPTYIGCAVCKEWHNFQNFSKWYDKNYYEIKDEEMHLDKDILSKENKIYSPENCVFVPKRINGLFNKKRASRGNLPIGVHWEESRNKYKVQCMNNKGKTKKIGRFNNLDEAFQAYKTFKENVISEIAEEYKGVIPIKLYKAMLAYEVEITD